MAAQADFNEQGVIKNWNLIWDISHLLHEHKKRMATTEPEHAADPGAAPVALSATGDASLPEQPRHGKRGAPQAFARKLAEILSTESSDCISWNSQGTAFQVHDVERFSEDILTKYYRHSKFSSFQRQLNLYSFRKIVKGADAGGYAHPMFRRDRPDDLYHVRRSISGSARYEPPAAAARAAAKRTAAAAALKQRASCGSGGGAGGSESTAAAAPRALKSAAAARRVGKLRKKAVTSGSRSNNKSATSAAGCVSSFIFTDHQKQQAAAAALNSRESAGAGGVFPFSTDITLASEAGESSPWTSGESGEDSDVGIKDGTSSQQEESTTTAKILHVAAASVASVQKMRERNTDSSNDDCETESSSSLDSEDDEGGAGSDCAGERMAPSSGDAITRHVEHQPQHQHQRQQHSSNSPDGGKEERLFSCAAAADKEGAGGDAAALLNTKGEDRGAGQQHQQGAGAGDSSSSSVSSPSTSNSSRKSPFNFFKKTFSFMDRVSQPPTHRVLVQYHIVRSTWYEV